MFTPYQSYKELLLAEIFIEARRSLGLDSASARLHSMYDLVETQSLHPLSVESMAKRQEVEFSPASASAFAITTPPLWELGRHNLSDPLAPAPRKKRRPKTAPNDGKGPDRSLQLELEAMRTPNHPSYLTSLEKASPSLASSSRRNSDAFPRSSGSVEEARDVQSQVLIPSLFSSKATGSVSKADVSSLPPSPPRSSESHRFDNREENNYQHRSLPPLPVGKQGILPNSPNPRSSNESQTLTNSSCEASVRPTCEIVASKRIPYSLDRGVANTRIG